MKKTILVLLVVGLFSLGANAQDDFKPANGQNPPPPPPMSKEKMKERKEMMLKTLKDIGATDEQIQRYKDVLEDSKKKTDELKKDAALTDDEKKAKRKEILTWQETKLKEILGDEKAKKLKDAMKSMRKDMPPPPPAEPKN